MFKSNWNKTIIGAMFSNPQYLDHFYLISNGISPALGHYQDVFIAELNSFLADVTQFTLWMFISGVGIGILILLVTYYIICFQIWIERKEVAQILRFLPPQYLILNKNLKNYLVRSSKELRKLLKDIEKQKFDN